MRLSSFLSETFDKFFSEDSPDPAPETSEDEQSGHQQNGHHKDIRLVRVIDRTVHVSPVDREREMDYVISNPTDEEFNFVFLPLREFKRNLQLFDEDGTKLNFYENRRVEEMINRLRKTDPAGWSEFQEKFKEYGYKTLGACHRKRHVRSSRVRKVCPTQAQPCKT